MLLLHAFDICYDFLMFFKVCNNIMYIPQFKKYLGNPFRKSRGSEKPKRRCVGQIRGKNGLQINSSKITIHHETMENSGDTGTHVSLGRMYREGNQAGNRASCPNRQ